MNKTAARDSTAFEVREALGQPGCAVCRLALRTVGRFLQAVAYEQVNDFDVRADLRAARGFCNTHAYRWLREAHNVLGTALIYRDLVRSASADFTPDTPRGLLDALLGRSVRSPRLARCPACGAQHEAERRYLAALLAILLDPASAEAFASSDGLCLVHTLAALRRGGPAAEQVLTHTRQRTTRLIAVLDEVIRKEDYRFRHEPRTEAERLGPADAVAWMRGAEGLVDER